MFYPEALKNDVFIWISTVSKDMNIPAYVVGGFVRDFFLGIKNDDIDIVVEGSGIEFAKSFAQKVNGKLSYYENYGTAMVKWNGLEVEFVGARKEIYIRGSRNPIVEDGTLYDDLERRDFTINAMAISLNENTYGELIDFFNGENDLKNKILKTPLDPDITFSDDPLRMFRAVRFISKLDGFAIDDNTKNGIVKNTYRSSILTRERITMEIEKMITYKDPYYGLILLQELGLWNYAFPNNAFDEKNVASACISHDFYISDSDKRSLRWFFLSQNYSGDYKSFIKKMKLSNELAQTLDKINFTYTCFSQMQYPALSIVRRCLDYSGAFAFIALIGVTCHSTIIGYNYEIIKDWHYYTTNVFYENTAFINYKLPCDGNEISEWSEIQPGILLGKLIKTIKEKIFNGEMNNSRDSIYAYVRYKKMKNEL